VVFWTGEGNIDSAVRRAEKELKMSTTTKDEELRAIVVEAVKLADDRLEIDRFDPDATILNVWSLESIMESVRSSIAHGDYELSADAIADELVGNWDDEEIEYSD
jgi:anti-sigma28 factor (negative regulator of flagellin synthesis)